MYQYLYIMYERSRRKKRTRAGHAICVFSRTTNSRRHYLHLSRETAIESRTPSVYGAENVNVKWAAEFTRERNARGWLSPRWRVITAESREYARRKSAGCHRARFGVRKSRESRSACNRLHGRVKVRTAINQTGIISLTWIFGVMKNHRCCSFATEWKRRIKVIPVSNCNPKVRSTLWEYKIDIDTWEFWESFPMVLELFVSRFVDIERRQSFKKHLKVINVSKRFLAMAIILSEYLINHFDDVYYISYCL